MSLFDKDLVENDDFIRQRIAVEENIALSLGLGACVVETEDTRSFLDALYEMLSVDYTILGTGPLADRLRSQQGRPILRWDVSKFCKDDAVGSMYILSQRKDKPIVVIENIADIPDGDRNIYDDPVLVENILLHSWKDDTIHLTHPQHGPFQLNKWDYTVIFPVKPGDIAKLHRRVPDGIGLIPFLPR